MTLPGSGDLPTGHSPREITTIRHCPFHPTLPDRQGVEMGTRHSLLATERTRLHEKGRRHSTIVADSYSRVVENPEALTHLGWQVYEWWIRLGNDTANAFYANPIAGGLSWPIFETVFHLEQMRDVIAATFFSNIWATFGLRSADASKSAMRRH
jgi:hypothetical protein